MTVSAPSRSRRALLTEDRFMDHLQARLKNSSIPDDIIRHIVETHRQDPFLETFSKPEPHPLDRLHDAEMAGKAREFWDNHR